MSIIREMGKGKLILINNYAAAYIIIILYKVLLGILYACYYFTTSAMHRKLIVYSLGLCQYVDESKQAPNRLN